MQFESEFVELKLDALHHEAAVMKTEGWRFIQTHAVNGEDGIDLYYSFMKDGCARNYKISGVTKNDQVPSITDLFLAAFVFENEARELFGVDMRDIVLDFQGGLYAPAEREPMTFISPEQKAARERAAKAASKKANASSEAASGEKTQSSRGGFVMTPERRARLDAKLATMSPEKVAKVQAALKAREAEASSASTENPATTKSSDTKKADTAPKKNKAGSTIKKDYALEEKLAAMDPNKAEKVRAALASKKGGTELPVEANMAASDAPIDQLLESKIATMEPEKAEKVRAALRERAKQQSSNGGGE